MYPVKYEVAEVESKPKPLFTEATLISKMENIHNDEEGEVKKILRDVKGIGTPATRGSIFKTKVNQLLQQIREISLLSYY